MDINFNLQPKQLEFFDLYEHNESTINGLGGSRGGTKSHTGRSLINWRRWQYPDSNAFIIMKTVDDLRDNHIRPMWREHPYLKDYWNGQEKILTFPNQSFIRFISAPDYDDIFKLYGKEAADIFVDQAEKFTQEQLEFLLTINRCTTNLKINPKILLTFNPGSIGHTYLKRVFVTKEYTGNERPEDFAFLRTYGWDNAKWCERYLRANNISFEEYGKMPDEKRFDIFVNHSNYGKRLNGLPDSQRRAQLFGDFDVFEGQFFSMWREKYHVIPAIQPNKSWEIKAALDYGQRTVLEVAGRDYEGNVIFFAECYTEHQIPEGRAIAIAEMLLEKKLYNLDIVYDTNMDVSLAEYVVSPEAPVKTFNRIFEQLMGDKAPYMRVVSKKTTDNRGYRVVCNETFKQGLYWKTEGEKFTPPKMKFTRDCKHLIKTAPELITDPDSPEGLDFDKTIGIQDPYDAAKMCLMELQSTAKPKGQNLEDQFYDLLTDENTKKAWKGGF